VKGFTRGVVWIAILLGAIGGLLYMLVFDVWVVPTGDPQLAAAILPTLMPEDKVLVQRGRSPVYGSLRAAPRRLRQGPSSSVRVFGTAGDRVEVTDSVVTTNGKGLAARHGCPQQIIAHPVTENLRDDELRCRRDRRLELSST